MRTRSQLWAFTCGLLVRWTPGLRRRVDHNLARIMPDLGREQRMQIVGSVGRNAGRTLSELLFNRQFAAQHSSFQVNGPGLEALEASRGSGAIVVSGHFGQWEAIRHVLKARGLTCGAIYKPNANGYYESVFLENIGWGGMPVFESGPRGMREIVRHLRDGGFLSLLLDQRFEFGDELEFLGQPALTSTVAAELALKYSVPLVPAYGTRTPDGGISVEFEPAIAHSTASEMTQEINDSISRRIRRHPEQWHWMHLRWKGTHRDSVASEP